jgi:hypothetical protein
MSDRVRLVSDVLEFVRVPSPSRGEGEMSAGSFRPSSVSARRSRWTTPRERVGGDVGHVLGAQGLEVAPRVRGALPDRSSPPRVSIVHELSAP